MRTCAGCPLRRQHYRHSIRVIFSVGSSATLFSGLENCKCYLDFITRLTPVSCRCDSCIFKGPRQTCGSEVKQVPTTVTFPCQGLVIVSIAFRCWSYTAICFVCYPQTRHRALLCGFGWGSDPWDHIVSVGSEFPFLSHTGIINLVSVHPGNWSQTGGPDGPFRSQRATSASSASPECGVAHAPFSQVFAVLLVNPSWFKTPESI